MAASSDNISMALFCDFENVALGVRDAKFDKFDIKPVLERLLLKGSIVVKKAYCDWERYKGFKAAMHEANFELIEIPHVRQSGKNSADIRLVVDALDLCYTKSHVNTFVIISGDSDFSPLVSKLRENAKQVIGVGVKDSTSDLLVANCDEFIFYDELVYDRRRAASTRADAREAGAGPRRSPEEERARREDLERRRLQGVEIAVETFEALVAERGDSGKIWASVLKEAIKRRNPGFSEGAYGFRTFGNLLEEAQALRLLSVGRDDKSGTYVFRGTGVAAPLPVNGPAHRPAAPLADERPAERAGAPDTADDSSPRADTGAEPVLPADEGSTAAPRAERERGGRGKRGRGRGGRSEDGTPRETGSGPEDTAVAAALPAGDEAADASTARLAPPADDETPRPARTSYFARAQVTAPVPAAGPESLASPDVAVPADAPVAASAPAAAAAATEGVEATAAPATEPAAPAAAKTPRARAPRKTPAKPRKKAGEPTPAASDEPPATPAGD